MQRRQIGHGPGAIVQRESAVDTAVGKQVIGEDPDGYEARARTAVRVMAAHGVRRWIAPRGTGARPAPLQAAMRQLHSHAHPAATVVGGRSQCPCGTGS